MNELIVIDERQVLGKNFRIYGDFENPLFLAKDVAEWIEHSNSRMMLDSVEEEEKVVRIVYTLGGNQESWFLTEDGLYEVLMQSRKPIAKEFKKEVKRILKTIRKHGMYATDELLANPDLIIQMATKLKEERAAKEALQNKVDKDKPKVLFADAVNASKTSILIGDLAKLLNQNGYDTGQKRLFEELRTTGYLIKTGSSKNMPTQTAMDKGLFEVKETSISNPDGSVRVTKTTKVTGKGQQYFINRYLGANHEAFKH